MLKISDSLEGVKFWPLCWTATGCWDNCVLQASHSACSLHCFQPGSGSIIPQGSRKTLAFIRTLFSLAQQKKKKTIGNTGGWSEAQCDFRQINPTDLRLSWEEGEQSKLFFRNPGRNLTGIVGINQLIPTLLTSTKEKMKGWMQKEAALFLPWILTMNF